MVKVQEDRSVEFVRLLAEHERRLQHYARLIVPNMDNVDDVLQESKLAMWQNFNKFQLGTNFNAWSHRFVFNQALAHRKKMSRSKIQYTLSDEFYESVFSFSEEKSEEIECKIDIMQICMEQLPEKKMALLKMRYIEKMSVDSISKQHNKKIDAIYRSISRVRNLLRDCVTRKMECHFK